jgi:drug/metabolite transporter (DMT)-like permease
MKKYRLIIFAIIMSFCTSTTVSFVIVYFNNVDNNFFQSFFERFLFAWPTVFLCIVLFVPIINKQLDKFLK